MKIMQISNPAITTWLIRAMGTVPLTELAQTDRIYFASVPLVDEAKVRGIFALERQWETLCIRKNSQRSLAFMAAQQACASARKRIVRAAILRDKPRHEVLLKHFEGTKKSFDIRHLDLTTKEAELRELGELGFGLRSRRVSRAQLEWLVGKIRKRELPACLLQGIMLSNPKLCGDDYRGIDLSGMDLRNAHMIHVDFTGANFRGADLTGAVLDWSDLTGADF